MTRSASEFDLNMHFLRESLWPAVIYTLILIIAGGIGNSFVLIVYRRNFLRSTTRMFIYSLAVLDLANCLLTMPSELAILVAFSSFPSHIWCRLSRYLTYTFNGSSSIILIVIAFDRFNKICRPTKQHLTIDRAKKICLAAVIFAAVCAIPALVLYGEAVLPIHLIDGRVHIISFSEIHNHTHAIKESDPFATDENQPIRGQDITVMGYFCLINSEYIDSELPLVFYLFMFAMYLVMVICIVFFYVRVAREMFLLQRRLSVFQTPAFQRTCPSIIHEEPQSENREEKQPVINIYGSNRSFDFSKSANHDDVEQDAINQDNCKQVEGANFTKQNEENVGAITVNCRKEKAKPENGEMSNPNVLQNDLAQEHESTKVEMRDATKVCDKKAAFNSNDKFSTRQEKAHDDVDGENSTRPLSSNKLLLRRIKSAEDLKAFKLDRLRVTNRTQIEHKSSEKKKNKGKEFIYRNRNSVRASKSCNNLHKTHETRTHWHIDQIESADPFLTPSNTLTLTRTSPKGGKRCIIALTGLSSKQVKTFETDGKYRNSAPLKLGDSSKPTSENQSSGHKSVSIVSPNQLAVPTSMRAYHSSLPRTQASRDEAEHFPEVQMRSKCSGEDESNEKAASRGRSVEQGVPRTPRAQVFSTGDILSDNQQVRSLHPGRTSRMLFIISLVFVISFLPFFLIVIVRSAAGSSFMSSLDSVALGVVSVFIRSSLISNAVNPIIYGILSTHFRRQCTTLLPSCLKRRWGHK